MKLFGEYLVEKEVLTEDKLAEALVEQTKSLPSVISILFDAKLITSSQILQVFKTQHLKRSGFIEAARELGIWTDRIADEVEKRIAAVKRPLGQILVEMKFAGIDDITRALDEFLVQPKVNAEKAGPVENPPRVDLGAEVPAKAETQATAEEPGANAYCELLTQERRELLLVFLGGEEELSEASLSSAKDILRIIRGGAKFAGATYSEALVTAFEGAIIEVLEKGAQCLNAETRKKITQAAHGVIPWLWASGEALLQSPNEESFLSNAENKKSYDHWMTFIEVLRFDIRML